jgi:putative ABC transport system permease protein
MRFAAVTPPLGWLQLRHRPLRLAVAVAGISFAVLLIMMQLGFRAALFDSAVRFHERLNYDIALFSTDSVFIVRPQDFSIRRLYQALGDSEVDEVMPVYIAPALWRNPWTHERRTINAIGFDPQHEILKTAGFEAVRLRAAQRDAVIFDALGRPEFGPVGDTVRSGSGLSTEINQRRMDLVGLFEMGPSFGIDGTIMTSEDNWLRMFPQAPRQRIHLGLLLLTEGADPSVVRDRLEAQLPRDVLVLTREQFVEREKTYWRATTPIGYIFAFGAIMGFVVGAIIVYQILFADVSEHLNEYATMRALGFSNGFVSGIVLQQAGILAVLGYIPGMVLAHFLYGTAADATRLPLHIDPERAAAVFAMTVVMCAGSALLAIRKVRRLDPADVF